MRELSATKRSTKQQSTEPAADKFAAALGVALGSAHNYVVAAKERRAESAQ